MGLALQILLGLGFDHFAIGLKMQEIQTVDNILLDGRNGPIFLKAVDSYI